MHKMWNLAYPPAQPHKHQRYLHSSEIPFVPWNLISLNHAIVAGDRGKLKYSKQIFLNDDPHYLLSTSF